jgi:hypothetical protein
LTGLPPPRQGIAREQFEAEQDALRRVDDVAWMKPRIVYELLRVQGWIAISRRDKSKFLQPVQAVIRSRPRFAPDAALARTCAIGTKRPWESAVQRLI